MNLNRQATWHEVVSAELRIDLRGTAVVGSTEPSICEGTYLVRLIERSPERCEWLCLLPDESGWEQISIKAIRDENPDLLLSVTVEGRDGLPRWEGRVPQLQGFMELEWSGEKLRSLANILWPRRINVRALAGYALPHGFFLAPSPDEMELESLVASQGPPPAGCQPGSQDYASCYNQPRKIDFCCVADPCGCSQNPSNPCPCGQKRTPPILVPTSSTYGSCTNCKVWGCPT